MTKTNLTYIQDIISTEINDVFSNALNRDSFNTIKTISKENRVFSSVELLIKIKVIEYFECNKLKYKYLKSILRNNGSSKAPYELLFEFNIDNCDYDIYVDLKPINTAAKSSVPFMGTINKYITRLENKKYFDITITVFYNSKINEYTYYENFKLFFVKDIKNFTLYKNWQFMVNVKNIDIEYGRSIEEYKNNLLKLLDSLKELMLKDININIVKKKNRINKI